MAILGIVVLEGIAIWQDVGTQLLGLAILLIAGLGGYHIIKNRRE
jgi:hypothetical protein